MGKWQIRKRGKYYIDESSVGLSPRKRLNFQQIQGLTDDQVRSQPGSVTQTKPPVFVLKKHWRKIMKHLSKDR